jgi:peptide deformylase
MATRIIRADGDAVLRKRSKEVPKVGDRIRQLLDDMVETLNEANGVGLAAPQVGVLRRIVVIDVGEGPIEMINPVVLETSGAQDYYEGCLSYPGMYGNARRPDFVRLTAQNRNGDAVEYRATGLFAVACCHEIDHLDGIMFYEKVADGKLYTREEVEQLREAEGGAGGEGTARAKSGEAGNGESASGGIASEDAASAGEGGKAGGRGVAP